MIIINKLEIENGKYQIENNNGIVKVYRYGELWLDGVTKFELCLIQRIEELEQQNKLFRKALEFYANEDNWMYGIAQHIFRGEKARQALKGEE